jgi:8-oxo-dGTP pyrophosphatase MutT (NUDIX family)
VTEAISRSILELLPFEALINCGDSMPVSDYVLKIRNKIGSDLLLCPSVAVSLFDQEGRLLLGLSRDVGRWIMIGGAIDPGERPADAAVREAWEETGLRVEVTELHGVFGGRDFRLTFSNGDEIEPCIILFEAKVIGGQMRPDREEIAELRYVTLNEVASLPMRPADRALVEAALRRKPTFQPAEWHPPTMG